MTPKQKIKVSKFLALILRHKSNIGIVLDVNGWAVTGLVVKALQDKFAGMSLSILKEIVAEDDKQRYRFDPSGHKIRANQGHSLSVDLKLETVTPPEYLFHGTASKTVWKIMGEGLRPMDRQFVHLSPDPETASMVGKRHGDPYIILVKSGEMAADGLSFYKSENAVWLTNWVPPEYLCFKADDDC